MWKRGKIRVCVRARESGFVDNRRGGKGSTKEKNMKRDLGKISEFRLTVRHIASEEMLLLEAVRDVSKAVTIKNQHHKKTHVQ